MNLPRSGLVLIVAITLALVGAALSQQHRHTQTASIDKELRDEQPTNPNSRAPWKTSRIIGTPEPPAPFRTEVAFPKLRFTHPVVLTMAPGANRWFVGQQDGRIFSFSNNPETSHTDPFLDISEIIPPSKTANQNPQLNNSSIKGLEALYGLTFHPQFAQNRFVYVCYVVRGESGQLADGTRVSRFTVSDSDPPHAIPDSEQIIISWLQGGHNGGCLQFGPDGMLYISTGDGGFANPPDGRNAGQDMTTLLSKVLRIDVDHPAEGKNYSIPRDNPFIDMEGVRAETWCYGLRNPWKMKFDRLTGELWLGDVGWELWELVFNVKKGANYGWSIVEGRQSVHPDRKIGPTPIIPPTIEIPHTDGVSITGGYVYRGRKYPELQGYYIWGDWETRRIWKSRWDESRQAMTPMQDIVDPTVRLVDFAEDQDGELFTIDYDNGEVGQLIKNLASDQQLPFPKKLSETGIFTDTQRQIPATGVVPFAINAEQWSDGALAQRYVALPGDQPIQLAQHQDRIEGSMFQSAMDFPPGTVLAKTLSLPILSEGESTNQPIETQLLHFDGRFWRAYSYAWDATHQDAELVDAAGHDASFVVTDASEPDGKRTQDWHYSSRVECARCHNQWAEYALAFNIRQLNRAMANSSSPSQLDEFEKHGLLELVDAQLGNNGLKAETLPRLANPLDTSMPLDRRARSWLHVNCAHCHRTGGGGSGYFELREEVPLHSLKLLDAKPTQGGLELINPTVLTAGDPYRSTLFYRISKIGSGHMPHLGASRIDRTGVALIEDWIRHLPPQPEFAQKLALLIDADETHALEKESAESAARIERLAQRFANDRVGKDPSKLLTGRRVRSPILSADRIEAQKQDALARKESASKRLKERQTLIQDLLKTPSGTLYLQRALDQNSLTKSLEEQVIDAALNSTLPFVRDLFENRFPEDRRLKRLGSSIRPEAILKTKGDSIAGRQLFLETPTVTCKQCHTIHKAGGKVGPDLTAIGQRLTREQLLDSILYPSRRIDPKFLSYLVLKTNGTSVTGILTQRTQSQLVLMDARGETITIETQEIDELLPQRQSLMPDLLTRDLTTQQLADLLAYLILPELPN